MHEHKIIAILRKNYPHHITIDPYELKPQLERVRGCSSWVDKRGTRTFGFKDEEKALDFMEKHGGKYVKHNDRVRNDPGLPHKI